MLVSAVTDSTDDGYLRRLPWRNNMGTLQANVEAIALGSL